MNDLWKDYRNEQKNRRIKRLPYRTKIILSLKNKGYKVEKKTEYQFRINDFLDIYPIHCRFHNIKTNKRGGFNPKDIEKLIKLQHPI